MSVQLAPELRIEILSDRWVTQLAEIEQLSFPTPWSEKLIRDEIKKDYAFALGLTFGDQLIAYAINNLITDELHVLTLAVHPAFREQGHGAHLVDGLLTEARNRGARSVFLEVRKGNLPAQKLYERFEFCFIGIRKEYYSDNREDAFVLKRLIR
ncbi:MAG: ribosomal protein S18-alanine N-acetyltransferase [Deltaproteobacteria bacterium]|nr:ribosomal protein S18-alanine N-acetyltransferase [Deltaproteobacteria bacterium]